MQKKIKNPDGVCQKLFMMWIYHFPCCISCSMSPLFCLVIINVAFYQISLTLLNPSWQLFVNHHEFLVGGTGKGRQQILWIQRNGYHAKVNLETLLRFVLHRPIKLQPQGPHHPAQELWPLIFQETQVTLLHRSPTLPHINSLTWRES